METALVSGASRGIGKAIALRLAESGYGVFLLGRDATALASVAEQCRTLGARAACANGDLRDGAWVIETVRAAEQCFGAIDVLINNAGASSRGAVQNADLDEWQSILSLNFTAAMTLSRAVLPGMIERRRGTVVNISSISGRHTGAGGAIYAASKHALNGFGGCMFEDVREYGIKVSTIMPGFVDTALTADLDLQTMRMIRPDDIADAVGYILAASANCCPTEIVIRPQRQP